MKERWVTESLREEQEVHLATVVEILQSIKQSDMSPMLSRTYSSEGGVETLDVLMKYLYAPNCPQTFFQPTSPFPVQNPTPPKNPVTNHPFITHGIDTKECRTPRNRLRSPHGGFLRSRQDSRRYIRGVVGREEDRL